VDSHKNAEVRGLLAPLAAMAAERGVAVVCVSHLTKAGGTEAMLRVMGSLGFVAAARAAYLVAKDPEDPDRRLFLPMKNNIAEDRGGLAREYPKLETSKAQRVADLPLRQALKAIAEPTEGDDCSETEKARQLGEEFDELEEDCGGCMRT